MKKEDIEALKRRLAEAEDALRAIREGEVDALVVSGSKGERIFSLSDSESIYRLMVETMSEAGLAVTPDGTILFANNCLVRMLQVPLEQVVGQPLARFISPSSLRRLTGLLEKSRVGPAEARLVLKAADRTAIPVHAWANLLERPDGPTVCLVGVDLSQLETSKELIQHLQEQRRALAQSEHHYRSLFDGMTEGFALHDIICDDSGAPCDYRFLEVNPAFERLTGLKRADVLGKRKSQVPQLRGDDPVWIKRYGEVALTGRPARFEQYSPALKRHYNVRAYRPAPGQFAVIFADITERKKIETEQQRLNEIIAREKDRLAALLNSISDEIWFAEPGGTFTLMNPAAAREFAIAQGRTVDIKSLADSLEVLRPDGTPRPAEESPPLRALNGQSIESQEEIICTPATGELRYRLCSSNPVRDGAGNIIGSVSVVRDITERKNAERAVAESQALLRTVFASMNEAVAVLDKDGRIAEFNDAFARFCRFGGRDECLKSIDAFSPLIRTFTVEGAPVPVADWPAARALRGESGVDEEYRIERTDTGESWIASTSYSPLRDKNGAVVGAVQSMRDVTTLKRAEEVLLRSRQELENLVRERSEEIQKKDDLIRRSQKIEALGTLAGGIAHDFNNILSTVLVNTELALLESDEAAKGRGSLALVIEAAQRGRDLVKQIITFSRQTEKEFRPVRVASVVRDALKLIRTSLPSHIVFREDIDDAGIALADPSQIHQIVTNLCVNAGHAMRETGGTLGVSLKAVEVDAAQAAENPELRAGPYLSLVVADNGCGMTAEVMDRIFDPFFTTKRSGEGTGMGLPVVHGIVKSYRGAVMVSSEPGKGSTFRIMIPRAQGAVEDKSVAAGVARGKGERILLVEDEAVQLQSLTGLLEHLGYAVTPRQDGAEALATFEAGPGDFDLVITDQTMPKLSGSQLAEAALRTRPGIPIILCTGFSEVVDAEKAKLLGVRGFLFKPFSMREISVTIRRALQASGQD